MNGTVRGFIVILAIAAVVFVLNLEGTLVSLSLILQIVFFLAIAVVLYMFWRDRMRHEIETWSTRSNRVFYGSAVLIIVDFAVYFWPGRNDSRWRDHRHSCAGVARRRRCARRTARRALRAC